jgi:hypothetical protein
VTGEMLGIELERAVRQAARTRYVRTGNVCALWCPECQQLVKARCSRPEVSFDAADCAMALHLARECDTFAGRLARQEVLVAI